MILWLWLSFLAFIIGMLALDLGILHRKAHVIHTREALRWTAVVFLLAMCFGLGLHFAYEHHLWGLGASVKAASGGGPAAMQFFTGYIIEQSLSLDNIFVIALIFAYFGIPRLYQHRVLFWGILGALVMRGMMILAGTALVNRFHWVIYLFGLLLIATAIRMLLTGEGEIAPDRNPLVRLARRVYPVSGSFEDERFFTRIGGKRAITPLFLCLLIVESTDVLFAVDSIPAVFAVTTDPFIVFTSNVFAILCLRSMYFALAGLLARFKHLKLSLVCILAFVGIKMLMSELYAIPTAMSLAVIGGILGLGAVASIRSDRQRPSALERAGMVSE